jgi:hypothetical protein
MSIWNDNLIRVSGLNPVRNLILSLFSEFILSQHKLIEKHIVLPDCPLTLTLSPEGRGDLINLSV